MHSGTRICQNHSSRSSGQTITGNYLWYVSKGIKCRSRVGNKCLLHRCRPLTQVKSRLAKPYSRDVLSWALRRRADRGFCNPLGPSLAWTLWFGKLGFVQALHWVDFTLVKDAKIKPVINWLIVSPVGTPRSVLTQCPPPSSSQDELPARQSSPPQHFCSWKLSYLTVTFLDYE